MLFQKETWLESNGLKYKKNHGAIILLLNYLVVSRFERRGFILHTQKKVVALPYVTSYAKKWFETAMVSTLPTTRRFNKDKTKSCTADTVISSN